MYLIPFVFSIRLHVRIRISTLNRTTVRHCDSRQVPRGILYLKTGYFRVLDNNVWLDGLLDTYLYLSVTSREHGNDRIVITYYLLLLLLLVTTTITTAVRLEDSEKNDSHKHARYLLRNHCLLLSFRCDDPFCCL